MKSRYRYLSILLLLFLALQVAAQEIGLNFNHNPENMDFNYIRKLPVKWVRTTSRILDYVDGKLNAISDTATQRVVDTSKMSYQVAFDLTASGEYVKNPLVYADFLRLLQH